MEPPDLSVTAADATQDDILERDLTRIRDAQAQAAAAFVEVGALVLRSNFDTSIYPQLAPAHLTQLSVSMTGNARVHQRHPGSAARAC